MILSVYCQIQGLWADCSWNPPKNNMLQNTEVKDKNSFKTFLKNCILQTTPSKLFHFQEPQRYRKPRRHKGSFMSKGNLLESYRTSKVREQITCFSTNDRNNIWWRNTDRSGIRTRATEVTGALNQRLRPLGHPAMNECVILVIFKAF